MNIQITGRNVTVNAGLKEYVEGRLGPVLAGYPRVESAHAILTMEKYRFTAEFVVQGKDKLREGAGDTTNDMYAAIDSAAVKLDKQLRKSRQKVVQKHKSRQGRTRLADVEPTE